MKRNDARFREIAARRGDGGSKRTFERFANVRRLEGGAFERIVRTTRVVEKGGVRFRNGEETKRFAKRLRFEEGGRAIFPTAVDLVEAFEEGAAFDGVEFVVDQQFDERFEFRRRRR